MILKIQEQKGLKCYVAVFFSLSCLDIIYWPLTTRDDGLFSCLWSLPPSQLLLVFSLLLVYYWLVLQLKILHHQIKGKTRTPTILLRYHQAVRSIPVSKILKVEKHVSFKISEIQKYSCAINSRRLLLTHHYVELRYNFLE